MLLLPFATYRNVALKLSTIGDKLIINSFKQFEKSFQRCHGGGQNRSRGYPAQVPRTMSPKRHSLEDFLLHMVPEIVPQISMLVVCFVIIFNNSWVVIIPWTFNGLFDRFGIDFNDSFAHVRVSFCNLLIWDNVHRAVAER